MNTYEKLAVITALEKAVKDVKSEIRAEAEDGLLDTYDSMGVEKLALKLNGAKVGEFAVTYASEGYDIVDPEAFWDFALSYGFASIRRRIKAEMVDSVINALRDHFDEELVRECVYEEVAVDSDWERYVVNVAGVPTFLDSGVPVPGIEFRPKQVKGTRVTGCKPSEVIPIVNQIEGGVNALLLGEGK